MKSMQMGLRFILANHSGMDLHNGMLPHHTKIDFWEEYARQVLLWFEPSTYSSLILADKPDLVDVSSSLGVEVTRSLRASDEEIDAVYAQYLIEEDTERRKRLMERLSQLNACVNEYVCLHPPGRDSFSAILDRHEKKLRLLNRKGYRVFDHNHLFVMSGILANDAMLEDALSQFEKMAASFEIPFERVIVAVPGYVYEFNIRDNGCSFTKLDRSIQYKLAMEARRSVLEAEHIYAAK